MEIQFNFGPGMDIDSGISEETNESWDSLPKNTPLMMDIPGLGRRIVEIPDYEVVD